MTNDHTQGRIQDFKLRGAHLKKLHRAEGGVKNVGVFRVKNHDFTSKNHIFSNFRGARAGYAPPGAVPDTGITSFTYSECGKRSGFKLYHSASEMAGNLVGH